MKILFVTDLCPVSDDEKGLPSVLLDFILKFIEFGHEVVLFRPNVISNVFLRGRKILPQGEYSYKGIKCINKNYVLPYFFSSQFNFLKNEKFDVILSHMPCGILAANKISKCLKIPYFTAVHASDIKVLTDLKYAFLRYSMKKAYREAKMVLPRSLWLKDKIENILPEIKTEVIPSGINSSVMVQNIKNEKFYAKPYKIFTAGSLIKRKNFSNLIKAVYKCPDLELTIAGDGFEMKALKKLVSRLNLDKRIKFLGQKPKDEIYKLMDEGHIFILPSINETFGMVYLEAMARGSVVVCTKNSGISGFIKDGFNGFLTEPDVNSIVQTLLKIQNAKNLEKIAENALNTAKEMTLDKMSENYLNLIQNNLF